MLTHTRQKCTAPQLAYNRADEHETRLTGRNGFPARQLISTHMNTGFKRFPPNNFTHFSLSFQSSFHLSLTVLVRYRSLAGI